ncbi:hypothetical protein BP00DRAFT_496967 [Aspergillus indologenus CBS 114.80]|uniref:Uncharacterized protein n=1 Tax=Aspergillus indologenus CBS 114.80 TaxID=1450541 RepID=A0A2V5HYT3_9EURO|nr:hypothetical protein BP00DRAFT_496967 [Aspergillus indologenus CBS 114.80]
MGLFKKNRGSTQSEYKPHPVPNFDPTEYGVVDYRLGRIIMVRLNPQACGQDWETIGQEITSAAWQKKRERATFYANRTDLPSSVEDTYLGPYGAMVRCDNQVGFYFEAPGNLALTPFPLRGTDGTVFHRYPGSGPYAHKTAFLQMMYASDATDTCAHCASVSDSDHDSRFAMQIVAFEGLIGSKRFDSNCLVARKGPDESIVLA